MLRTVSPHGASRREPGRVQPVEDVGQRLQLEIVELHVLPRRQLAFAAAVHVRDLADRAELRRREDPARNLHAQHERPDLRLVVVEPPPLEPDDVLLGDLLVPGSDQRGQLVEHPERALLPLQALDGVPLENKVEGRGFCRSGRRLGHRVLKRGKRGRAPVSRRSPESGNTSRAEQRGSSPTRIAATLHFVK